jgi:hypothetical protein
MNLYKSDQRQHELEMSFNTFKQPSREISGLQEDMNISPKDLGIFSRNMTLQSNGKFQSGDQSPNSIMGKGTQLVGRNSSLLFGLKDQGNHYP